MSFDLPPKDQKALTLDEQYTLHNQIIPTARSWLKIPGLRDLGIKTLEYWGERP